MTRLDLYRVGSQFDTSRRQHPSATKPWDPPPPPWLHNFEAQGLPGPLMNQPLHAMLPPQDFLAAGAQGFGFSGFSSYWLRMWSGEDSVNVGLAVSRSPMSRGAVPQSSEHAANPKAEDSEPPSLQPQLCAPSCTETPGDITITTTDLPFGSL